MGNEHFYKYSHAKNWNDVKRINANHNYRPEIDEKGSPIYIYHQLEHPGNHEGGSTSSSPNATFGSAWAHWRSLYYYNNNMPSLKGGSHIFSRCDCLQHAYVDLPNFKGSTGTIFFQICGELDVNEIYYVKMPQATSITNFMSGGQTRRNSDIKLYAPLIKTFHSVQRNVWYKPDYFKIEIYAPLLENADGAFNAGTSLACPIQEINIGLDEDGEVAFNTGKVEVSKIYATWKHLKTAKNMFFNCPLTKEYGLEVLNDLPSYIDGKNNHPFCMSFNMDYTYDPEVNLALKRVDKDFITPIEEMGGDLPEDVLEDKGWDLSCTWGHPAYTYPAQTVPTVSCSTKNEFLSPQIIAKLELDTINLPPGYVRCEYLESDANNQYIDTGIIPTDTTGTYQIAKKISNVNGMNLAVRSSSTYYYPGYIDLGSPSGTYDAWGPIRQWTEVPKNGTVFESYMNYPIDGNLSRTSVIITNNNSSYTREISTTLPVISHSLYLFGRNNSGVLEKQWGGRVYRCKISEGTEIIRDYIPCLDPDGKPCMRDIINGVDYYNQGTGEDFLYKIYEK